MYCRARTVIRFEALNASEDFVNYDFEWDQEKAKMNRRKHGISFEQAATVFKDSRALSTFDDEHSGSEDRWITMGISAGGGVLIVHHTFEQVSTRNVRIRIFSSRKASKQEISQYAE